MKFKNITSETLENLIFIFVTISLLSLVFMVILFNLHYDNPAIEAFFTGSFFTIFALFIGVKEKRIRGVNDSIRK
jgi:hypothetical protein